MTLSKIASETAMGRSNQIGLPQLPHFGRSATRSTFTRFKVPQNGQATVALEWVSVVVMIVPNYTHRSSPALAQ